MKDEEVEDIFNKLAAKHRDQLNAFYQLRALFGPVIEGLILLDRLSYVLEQNCTSHAFLVKLFDPVISPRCYAIVAWKQ